MDSDGDFYIGNTKYSSQSGEQTVFDVPIPTITGEDPNRLSVVFDEVIVKERILVEGGSSQQILSQFDGPVTFNGDTRFNAQLIVNNKLRVTDIVDFKSTNNATSCTDNNASLRVAGGVGIAKDVHICGDLNVQGEINFTGIDDVNIAGNIVAAGGTFGNIRIAITDDNTIDTTSGKLTLNSASGEVEINDNLDLNGTLNVSSTLDVSEATTLRNTVNIREDGDNTLLVQGTSAGHTAFSVNAKTTADASQTKVFGSLEVDGIVRVDSTTQASSTTTGALQVDGGVGIVKNLHVGGTITAPTFKGNLTGSVSGSATQIKVTNTNSGTNYLTFTSNHIDGTYDLRASDRYYITPSSTASGASELFVRGDIIAYAGAASDDKLKTNKLNITGALDKVNSLSGFTFEWNDLGKKILDADDTNRYLGVSAQEVQKIAPEAIKEVTTPEGDAFLTVKYEKLVPLLIESIKELSAKVSTLEDILNN